MPRLLSSPIRKYPRLHLLGTIVANSSLGLGAFVGHGISEKIQEKLTMLERTIDRQGTIRLVLILCGAVPFLGACSIARVYSDGASLWSSVGARLSPAWHELVLEGDDSNHRFSWASYLWTCLAQSKHSRCE